jgi:hypothetical protein
LRPIFQNATFEKEEFRVKVVTVEELESFFEAKIEAGADL